MGEEEKRTTTAPQEGTAPKKRRKRSSSGSKKTAAKAAPTTEGAEAPAEKPAEKPKKTTTSRSRTKAKPAEAKAEDKTEKKPAAEETPAPKTKAEETPAAPEAEPAKPEETPAAPKAEPPEAEPAKPEETPAAPETPEQAEPAESAQPDAPTETAEPSETPASADETTKKPESEAKPETPAEAAVDSDEDDAPLPPDEEQRVSDITRTAQLSIQQIMAGLDEDTAPAETPREPQPEPAGDTDADTDAMDDADTLPQMLGRGVSNMAKWLVLVLVFVVAIAGGGVAFLYHNATPDMLPQINVSFDGQTLPPTAYRWHVPVVGEVFKRTYAETLSAAPIVLDEPVSGASPDFTVSSSKYSSEVTLTDMSGEELFTGSIKDFNAYLFTENGTYNAKLVLKSTAASEDDDARVTGSETWQFQFDVNIKPTIQLCNTSAVQGSVAAVRIGTTLSPDAPAIKTELANTGFVKAANGWICYLPIPWNEPTGAVDVTVTADGYTETLQLEVRAASFTYKDYSRTSQMTSPYIGENDAPDAVAKLLTTVDDTAAWSIGGFVQPFLNSFSTPLTFGMTEYAGRSSSERGTNYGYGGRTSTNVVITPKKSNDSMIVPASGRVLLAKNLGGIYGNTVVIEHGAGLKSIFYGLASLNVETGDNVKQGQLLGVCGKTVVAEMRLGEVPIDPLLVWRGQCDGLKNY